LHLFDWSTTTALSRRRRRCCYATELLSMWNDDSVGWRATSIDDRTMMVCQIITTLEQLCDRYIHKRLVLGVYKWKSASTATRD
jgi:hypothetical protein